MRLFHRRMARPRILIIPEMTLLEWPIRAELEAWADVAGFEAPGVGGTPRVEHLNRDVLAERAERAMDERGWDRCVVAADEFAVATAIALARRRPQAIEALALGHPCLSFRMDGERPPVEASCWAALDQLAQTDFRSFARHMTQVTQGAYGDDVADDFIARVPQDVANSYWTPGMVAVSDVRATLEALDAPMLFAEHKDCMMFTREGFEDAVAAFPQARVIRTKQKPSASPEFAAALRALCESLEAPLGSLQGDAQSPG